jgi:hypothetical protein
MSLVKLKYTGMEPRYFPGLGTVLNHGDTVNVPASEADSYLGQFAPVKPLVPQKGRLLPDAEKGPDA